MMKGNGTMRKVAMATAGLGGMGVGYVAVVATGYPEVGFMGLALAAAAGAMVGEALGPWRDEVMGHRVGDEVMVLWADSVYDARLVWTPAMVVGFGHGAMDLRVMVLGGWNEEAGFMALEVMGLEGGAA
jgi:hypothetical protein